MGKEFDHRPKQRGRAAAKELNELNGLQRLHEAERIYAGCEDSSEMRALTGNSGLFGREMLLLAT